ncbi:MAG: xanthine phosphoribosyltransferase [Clostridia bacterium]|nr:xanthine phosphoribosyltransferase [Clostridia bacterium]
MKELEREIQEHGVGIGKDVVKVDSFLNHRIDVGLATEMGKAIHEAFADAQVDCILTVEASGIATSITAAQAFGNIPVIFAKKGETTNVSSDVYTAQVYSFTHQVMNTIRVSRDYLQEGMKILIVDDFLANGEAVEGLISIARQARAELVGVAVCVEKGFQEGGKRLRAEGIRIVSLAIVDAIEDGKIVLRSEEA